MTSKYERIKAECKRKNVLWEDPDFQAVQSSVFYYQTPPFTFQWKRITEIVPNPLFINDGEQFDIIPGKMGDRWLVSCLGVLFSLKNLFYRVVPADQSFENYHGVFRFRLWWCGEWVEVLVDDRLPTINGKLSFLQPLKSNCFWVALLEKAIAKLHGSYEALKYGTRADGLSDLTGGIVETIPVKSGADSIRPVILRSILDATCIITCIAIKGNCSQFKSQPEKLPNGIAIGVSYRLCSLDKVENTMGDSVQLARLEDPMTSDALGVKTGYTGDWSAESPLWDRVSEQERDRLLGQLKANEFWMSFVALTETFTNLECIHLDTDTARDESSLNDRPKRWSIKMFQEFWRKGVTAGGCRNHDSFHINPQLQLFVAEKEDVIIALNQHTAVEPKVIGFTMYKLNSVKNKLTEDLSREFFKNQISFINSDYGNSRHISYRCNLDVGRYLLMATTYEPGEESGFTVRLLGNHIKLAQLETQTMMILDPFPPLAVTQQRNETDTTKKKCQYEPIFMQLADENRSINSFELQELLDACLPNDYIKSCASIDICRQVVSFLDKTGHGRINFVQFKTFITNLKVWQGVFKMYSKEKAGILRAERLRDALYDVGFKLSSDIMSVIMLKYMRKDGTLRLGDFASAILHLTTAFEVFQRKDHDQDNVIKIEMGDLGQLENLSARSIGMGSSPLNNYDCLGVCLVILPAPWIKSVLRC